MMRTTLVLALSVATIIYALALIPYVGDGYDDGHYLALAQALAHGKGFSQPQMLGNPPEAQYPPGWPLLIALVWLVIPEFPASAIALKFVAMLCALISLTVFALLFAVFVLPFFFWDSGQFIENVFRYPTDYSEHPYPIKSLGFGGLALALGWIPSESTIFPFERLQPLFGIPTLVALIWFLDERTAISRLWLCCGILTLVISFFSRVFNDNYLGYLGNLIILGILSDDV